MQIAIIGLGKMGGNMAKRLLRGGHQVVAYDRDAAAVAALAKEGATAASSLEDVVSKLTQPRAVWVMVPSGKPFDMTKATLMTTLAADDIVIEAATPTSASR